MTSNMSLDQINVLLDRMNVNDDNIRIVRSIGQRLQFLDVLVVNDHGRLKTSVYHKPAAEPYIVPFLSEHPRHIHRNTIRGALYRAARLCSHVDDFDDERLHVELKLLLNGYPAQFVAYYVRKFFHDHDDSMTMLEQPNQIHYRRFRMKLLGRLSQCEHRHKQSMAMLDVDDASEHHSKKANEYRTMIRVPLSFDSGLIRKLNDELRLLWKKHYVYDGSVLKHVRLQFAMQLNASLRQLLVRTKPPRQLLVDPSTTIRQASVNASTTNKDYVHDLSEQK
jgi:hypothetical protein